MARVSVRVPVKPALLQWARKRARLSPKKEKSLAKKFKKLPEWESGDLHPTLNQLRDFAKAVHVPLGYLFLSSPPNEPVPIPDFRTIAGKDVASPSPDLLDTIYICQERQSWYHEYARAIRSEELPFVGKATIDTPSEEVAAEMREMVDFKYTDQHTRYEPLRRLISKIDKAGILVMVSGVVRNNTSRRLDPQEFRGFALSDELAPLIFINGADSKAAQMFTLAHELAHIWLGASAISNFGVAPEHGFGNEEEVWCNEVAAEFLVPLNALIHEYESLKSEQMEDTLTRLKKTGSSFKCVANFPVKQSVPVNGGKHVREEIGFTEVVGCQAPMEDRVTGHASVSEEGRFAFAQRHPASVRGSLARRLR